MAKKKAVKKAKKAGSKKGKVMKKGKVCEFC